LILGLIRIGSLQLVDDSPDLLGVVAFELLFLERQAFGRREYLGANDVSPGIIGVHHFAAAVATEPYHLQPRYSGF
jgi:hypothetical protein